MFILRIMYYVWLFVMFWLNIDYNSKQNRSRFETHVPENFCFRYKYYSCIRECCLLCLIFNRNLSKYWYKAFRNIQVSLIIKTLGILPKCAPKKVVVLKKKWSFFPKILCVYVDQDVVAPPSMPAALSCSSSIAYSFLVSHPSSCSLPVEWCLGCP